MKKWVPTVKEQWLIATTNVEPHLHSLKTKTLEIYASSKDAVTPHVLKVQEIADPYFQVIYFCSNLNKLCITVYVILMYVNAASKLGNSASHTLTR